MMLPGKNRIDRLFLKALVFSFSLHLLVFSLLLIKGISGKKVFYLPAYEVRIVGSIPGKNFGERKGGEKFQIGKKGTIPIHEEKGTEILSLSKKREEREILKEISSFISRIRQKSGSEMNESAGGQKSGVSEIRNDRGVSGGSSASVGRASYFDILWINIKNNWSIPPELNAKKNALECIVGLKIKRNGIVMNIWMEKGSGNKLFDESALRAISKTAPFPPFPSEINSDFLEIGVRFRGSDT
ncbi:MAG: energy transducer TonB [Candidatus Aenigmatarchaeota archaeon]